MKSRQGVYSLDPLRESRHRNARSARELADWLAWLQGAKGSKDRQIPMTVALSTALANLLFLEGIGDSDYLWYDRPGGTLATAVRRSKPIADTSFHRWWVRCLEEADVPYRKPHTTRHTFATRLDALGLPMDQISSLLGHASISTTADLYVHTKMDAIGENMRDLFEKAQV